MSKRRLIAPLTVCFALAVVGASRAEDDTPVGARKAAVPIASLNVSINDGAGISGLARTPSAVFVGSNVPNVSHSNAARIEGAGNAAPPSDSPSSSNSRRSSASSRSPVDAAGVPQGRAVIPPKS